MLSIKRTVVSSAQTQMPLTYLRVLLSEFSCRDSFVYPGILSFLLGPHLQVWNRYLETVS